MYGVAYAPPFSFPKIKQAIVFGIHQYCNLMPYAPSLTRFTSLGWEHSHLDESIPAITSLYKGDCKKVGLLEIAETLVVVG